MTGFQALEARTAVGVTMAVGSIAAWTWAPRIRASRVTFSRWLIAAYAATRLGLYALVFLVLHIAPRGDIHMYMQEAGAAFRGALVYRDFPTPHAPLDPYLLAAMLHLHYSALTVILFATLFDIATLALWVRLGQHHLSEDVWRRAGLFMLFNATSLLTVAVDGQMNALIALLLVIGVWTWSTQRSFFSGAWVAGAGAFVKFLAWIFAPGFFFVSRRRWTWVFGFLLVMLTVYGGFAIAGADITFPLHAEGTHKTSSNLIYLVELATGHDLGNRLPDLLLAASWFSVVALTALAARRIFARPSANTTALAFQLLAFSMIAELMCVQVFSKNTWDRYLVMAMFPLCLVMAEATTWQVLAYAVWNVVNVSYRSFWSTAGLEPAATDEHILALHGDRVAQQIALGELLQTAGNILLFILCIQRLRSLAKPSDVELEPRV